MKKIVVLLLILAMAACTFTACNNESKATATAKANATTAKPVATATESVPTEVPTPTAEPTPTPVPEEIRELPITAGAWDGYTGKKLFVENTGHSATQVDNSDVGCKIVADKAFGGITAACPSYSDNVGYMVFRVYTWDTDYETTISKAALDVGSVTDFNDNAVLSFKFATDLPAGTYLITITEGEGGVGVWTADPLEGDTSVMCYLDGEEDDAIGFEITAMFAG